MFDHVAINTASFAASGPVYRQLLELLGKPVLAEEDDLLEWEDFDIGPVMEGRPQTENVHVGFLAPSDGEIEAFWRLGQELGLADDGPPGERPQYGEGYRGAFLRDLDGNSIEACRHPNSVDGEGVIDHLWLRVGDLAASRDFYALIAPYSGFALAEDRPDFVLFRGPEATFSLVPGEAVTRNLHVAFPTNDDAVVAAFHAAAVGAGHRDNGAPGERPQYHPGYVGAFVLDPDGNNIEVVNHNRA